MSVLVHALMLLSTLAVDPTTCPEGHTAVTGGCADPDTGIGAVCFVRPGRLMAAGVNIRLWETGVEREEGAPPRFMGDSELDPDELARLANGRMFCFLTTEGVHSYAGAAMLQKGMKALVPIATLLTNPKVPVGKTSVRVYPGQVTVISATLEPGANTGGDPTLTREKISIFDDLYFDPEDSRRLAPWLVPVPELERWMKATRAADEEPAD